MATRMLEIEDRDSYKRRMTELAPLDPATVVLLTVDLQRDYLDPEVGSNQVEPTWAKSIVETCAWFFPALRAMDVPVIHSYVTRRPEEIAAGLVGSPLSRIGNAAKLSQNAIMGVREIPDRLVGSPQAEVPSALVAEADVHITDKKTMDSTLGTNLLTQLRDVYRPELVLVSGINTDTCVYSTAFSLANNGFGPVVISDCTGSTRGRDHHEMALELLSRTFAWSMTAADVVERLERAG